MIYRPFHVVAKSDRWPAVRGEIGSKKQQYVYLFCPSQYGIQKVKNVEYVELWCFSLDDCHEAADTSRSTCDVVVDVGEYVMMEPPFMPSTGWL
jgi:hypothetical protein